MIGIDDFARRRGRSFGSIVVDLERRTVIDILPDGQRDTIKYSVFSTGVARAHKAGEDGDGQAAAVGKRASGHGVLYI